MGEIIFDKTEDWENRVLCSDESCIGTIGPDSKCKECGKPYDGVLKATSTAGDVSPETNLNKLADLPQNPEISKNDTSGAVIADDDWDKRVLCSDGACIGTIGPDGRCKECGKPAEQ